MAQNQNFKLNTSNYIGFQYKQYLTRARAMALTEPTKYAILRNQMITDLTDSLSKEWYERTYSILTNGPKLSDNEDLMTRLGDPSYPAQELAKLALSHTETIVEMMEEIVELLLPADNLTTAMHQLEKKKLTDGIQT